jgi:hypothetical protein
MGVGDGVGDGEFGRYDRFLHGHRREPGGRVGPHISSRAGIDQWRKRILDDLGGDGVDPDLTDQQLDAALERALELFNKHKPFGMWFPFDLPAAETTAIYFFAEPPQTDGEKHPYTVVRNILDVQTSDRNRRILGPRAGFLEGYYLRWGYQGPRTFFELHTGERLYERLTGSRPDWYWDSTSRTLYLSNPSRDLRAMVYATRERHIDEIRFDNEIDFRRLAVAAAKRILARVLGSRSVGGGFPGAAGAIVTDAAELRAEGEREWREIEARLERALVSVPPPGYVG